MTDNLRDRIREEVLDGILSMFSESDSVEMAAGYIADAVIKMLGLRKEQDDQQRPIHSCATVRYRRYVTKWETDD